MSITHLLRSYRWLHTGLGLFGNLAFLIGSILFLRAETMTAGVWLFIFGSAGMLVHGVAEAVTRQTRGANGYDGPRQA